MEAGLGRLRLTPRDFWSMTVRELTVLLGGPQRRPLGRGDLAALMAAWPDEPAKVEQGGTYG
ncbi:phage tail assembly chaperone [Rhizobium sp. G21]|uniref:phage tail assembly chaperone n=1 Tax=Rhizobium sp. G21 TaxID=2758439 RepID=UPI001601D496|nr:phage tail assembly chaperone [Rhizobium sp. G21]MBB1248281.1 phage tail assembly chaperone [Rhizobium sp. G21]